MEFLDKYKNSIITSLNYQDNVFSIGFGLIGKILNLRDEGQCCCEYRYMVCDDNLDDFVGAKFLDYEIRDVQNHDIGAVHEVQFLIIFTSAGAFTVANHNEHNGYYGGFSIEPVESPI